MKVLKLARVNHSKIAITLFALSMSACSSPSGLFGNTAQENIKQNVPIHWQDNKAMPSDAANVVDGWLASFNDNALADMVAYALENNYQLAAERINVELAKERLQVSAASDFPELTLSLDNARSKQVSDDSSNYQSSADISLDLRYELDLWGKLSEQQNQNRLKYAASQATFKQLERDLVANVSQAWFDLIQAQQLLSLYQERADNLQSNLAMIESSYQLGLNDALDVYLTKNTVNQELARVSQQRQTLLTASRQLELLLGDYPIAKRVSQQKLPLINDEISLGLPAQLLTRRADIQAQWLELLALDAGLAVAHKQRFPSFNLIANVSDSADELTQFTRWWRISLVIDRQYF